LCGAPAKRLGVRVYLDVRLDADHGFKLHGLGWVGMMGWKRQLFLVKASSFYVRGAHPTT
jgi:hypothetical protein